MSKKQIRITVIILLAVVVIVMIIYPYLFNKQENNDSNEPSKNKQVNIFGRKLNINTQIIKYESINDVIRTKGILIPDEEVELSFESSGKITDIFLKKGRQYKKINCWLK